MIIQHVRPNPYSSILNFPFSERAHLSKVLEFNMYIDKPSELKTFSHKLLLALSENVSRVPKLKFEMWCNDWLLVQNGGQNPNSSIQNFPSPERNHLSKTLQFNILLEMPSEQETFAFKLQFRMAENVCAFQNQTYDYRDSTDCS